MGRGRHDEESACSCVSEARGGGQGGERRDLITFLTDPLAVVLVCFFLFVCVRKVPEQNVGHYHPGRGEETDAREAGTEARGPGSLSR